MQYPITTVKWMFAQVLELQKALSDANVYLFDEREQVLAPLASLDGRLSRCRIADRTSRVCFTTCSAQLLRLQAENDSLKIQEIEDRRRIQHLLALTQPVTQEVTFFRDCRPEKMTRYPGASMAGSSASAAPGSSKTVSTSAATPQVRAIVMHGLLSGAQGSSSDPLTCQRFCDAQGGASSVSAAGDSPSQRVLRTVYLPSERADALLLTTQALQQQVDDLKKLMDQRAEVLPPLTVGHAISRTHARTHMHACISSGLVVDRGKANG
jgi:hypothetical protein